MRTWAMNTKSLALPNRKRKLCRQCCRSAVPTAVCYRNVCVARHEWATQKYDPKAVTNGLGIFVLRNCRVCHRNICVAFRHDLHKTSGNKSHSSEDLSAWSSERNFAWAIRAGPRKNGGSKWMPALPAAANENRLCRSAAANGCRPCRRQRMKAGSAGRQQMDAYWAQIQALMSSNNAEETCCSAAFS